MLFPNAVSVHPWGVGGAHHNTSHRIGTRVMAFPWFELSQLSIQRPKLLAILAREGRSHLLWSAGGTSIHSVTLQHGSHLLKFRLWGELRGLRAAPGPAVEHSAAHSSFVSHHFCIPVLHFLVPAEPSGEDSPLNFAVLASCFCCPSQHLQKYPQKCFYLSGVARLQLGVSVLARHWQGSPCSHCAPVPCRGWGLGIKKVLVHLVVNGSGN